MTCQRCQGLMLIDYYIDMQDDQGTHWLKAWRCIGCGEVVDPGILRRRMVRESRLPGFVERVSGRRKARRTFEIVPMESSS